MAKLDIDFVLLDESVVLYGFRVLMSGGDLSAFTRNPVMLFMHNRAPQGASYPVAKQEMNLPIGRWHDVRIESGKLLAKPEFDDEDEFALRVQQKVKKGYLNAASIWLDPLAASDEDTLKMPGQSGPTVTKWNILEASIVDIPNCKNALAIRDSKGKALALSAGAGPDATAYLSQLAQAGVLRSAPAGRQPFPGEAEALVETAIRQGKIGQDERGGFLKLAAGGIDTVRRALDRIPVGPELAGLLAQSGRELYLSGSLMRLKELSEPDFRSKFREFYGFDFKGQ